MYPTFFVPNLDGRQHSDIAYFEINIANFNDPKFAQVIPLQVPAGSQVLRCFANVTEAFDAATTDTLVIGDSADEDRYGTAVDLKTTGLKQFTPTGFIYGTDGTLQYILIKRIATGTAATKGKVMVFVETVAASKAYHTQG